jgi:chloramphenicol-sensitive protein RarD
LQNRSTYKGVLYTCIASFFWGIPQPLFFNEIRFIPAIEIAIHRGLWSFTLLLLIIIFLGKIKDFFNIFYSFKKILLLSITSILITINWTGFIFAVSINKVQDASMGYYMTPMISIALGYFFLKEKISILKFFSILIMSFTLIYLTLSLNTFPYIAILIGVSWGFYGLIRKRIKVSSEIGLLYESGFITLFAAPYLIYLNYEGSGFFLNSDPLISILLFFTGIITIFPLFFFNLGVKYIPLGFAGVIFFLAPTFHFITSVFILNEDISFAKIISFIIIWVAIILFIIDIFIEERRSTRVILNN